MWDQEGVHEIYRDWRAVLEEYGGDRVLVAEAWASTPDRLARYVRPDEMHQAFNFHYLDTPWEPTAVRRVVDRSLAANAVVGAPTTWVLSNHDVVRHATRLGYPVGTVRMHGIGIGDEQPDVALGLRRARAATLQMLALPGSAYLYQGEELGLFEVADLPEAVLADPVFRRTHGEQKGRDGCRVPIPWTTDGPSFGFGLGGAHLPQPDWFGPLAVEAQSGRDGSTLELYRRALRLRKELIAGEDLRWLGRDDGPVLHFGRPDFPGPGGWQVLTNFGTTAAVLPPGEVVLASGPLAEVAPPGTAAWAGDEIAAMALPPDTTVWIKG
jgi:alpha-glucosidase